MPGYSSYDDLLLEITTNGKLKAVPFYKISSAPEAAGVMHSLWLAIGTPGAGANPATTPGTAYDDTAGGIFLPDQASDLKYLLACDVTANQNCSLILYDRLVGVSGISIASTGDKTISSAALPRYTGTDAAGNEIWLEVTTATTTTAAIISANAYTDEGGNAGVGGSVTFPAVATNVGVLVPLTLAAADYGVRAISTINVSTAASAGIVNVLIVRRLATIPLVANIGAMVDFVRSFPALPRLYDGATLGLALVASGASVVTVQGSLTFGWG